ncbi:PREDICTED: myb-like protein J [Brassica oleracea var. oleracea]|uniref:Uncharacterized protein n=1 Tax=Brassica oleracea var. oleracea TaxID=109376 RepID=A0A0D3ACA3_BRAOL|nr:PREDICTED: myb-like protein J [Brassica oleracea var. oleracea]
MTRRCSHCNHNGHNSRTCPNPGVMLFGVRLTEGSIRKSASLGNLLSHGHLSGNVAGTTWTEEEHRRFLLGLQKLGKGDWRGISRKYVRTRTPTQVASHAQKYFMKQSNVSTLHDMVHDHEGGDIPMVETKMESGDYVHQTLARSTSIHAPSIYKIEVSEYTNSTIRESTPTTQPQQQLRGSFQTLYQVYLSPHYPFPLSVWTAGYVREPRKKEGNHVILIPTAVHSKAPINVDDLFGMTTKLSLGESKEMENPICLFR